MNVEDDIREIARLLSARSERLSVAESCTGGWLSKCLTDLPGSSAWFEQGVVTYSNAAKRTLLAVPEATLEQAGAVSGATVEAMVQGLLRIGNSAWAVAISGIAGPDGGSADKPVGTVWIGWGQCGHEPGSERFLFEGDRNRVREQAVIAALSGLLDRMQDAAG